MISGDGVGLGHATRTRLLAEALVSRGHTVLVLTDSEALAEATSARLQVEWMPAAFSELAPRQRFEALLARFKPHLVTEDTGTRPDLRSIPAIKAARKVLLLRRVDGYGLERYRRAGTFDYYDRTFVLSTFQELLSQPTVLPVTRRAMRTSRRFRYFGPIYRTPSTVELDEAAARYRNNDTRLVVVSAGGGGDHGSDTYCKDLYDAVPEVAAALNEMGDPVKIVLVTGPLYRAPVPPLAPGLEVVAHEPALHALLHIADVAVLRPGTNVLFEAMSGSARLVLVPGKSHFEDQASHSQSWADAEGAVVSSSMVDDLVKACHTQVLAGPRQSPRPAPSAEAAVVAALMDEGEGRSFGVADDRPHRSVFVLLSIEREDIEGSLPFSSVRVRRDGQPLAMVKSTGHGSLESIRAGVYRPADWTTVLPRDIDEMEIDLLLTTDQRDSGGGDYLSAMQWLSHFASSLSVVSAHLETVMIDGDDWKGVRDRTHRAFAEGRTPAFLLQFAQQSVAVSVAGQLRRWFGEQSIRTLSPSDLGDALSSSLIAPDPS